MWRGRAFVALVPLVLVVGCGSSATSRGGDTGSVIDSPANVEPTLTAPTADCTVTDAKLPDVIQRFISNGTQWEAQLLGGFDYAACGPSIANLAFDSPALAGDCTQIALASDNPGYDVNAAPAPPLKHVANEVGPAC
jgi:hypothetical protein